MRVSKLVELNDARRISGHENRKPSLVTLQTTVENGTVLTVESHDSGIGRPNVVEPNGPVDETGAQEAEVRRAERQTADGGVGARQQIAASKLLARVPQPDVSGVATADS